MRDLERQPHMNFIVNRPLSIINSVIVALALLVNNAHAQPYPTRPVRVIVNFPPGAGVDIATRIVTARLGDTFGQQFVIDNRVRPATSALNSARTRLPMATRC